MHDTDDLIDIGHTQVAYRRTGQGPDLLFIHGWPLNGHTWRGIVPALSESFTCHVIDLPGAGASVPTGATPLSLRGHVTSVQAVIDTLGLTDLSLVAHNSGGMIARRVAAARPTAVRSLVLAGTEIPHHNSWLLRMFVHGTTLPGASAIFRRAIGARALRRSPVLFGATVADRDHLDGEFHRLFIQPLLDDDELWAAQFEVLATFDFDDVDQLASIHRQLTMPTLLLWGEQDPFFPAAKARAMQSQFAGPTSLASLSEGSLLVHDEHPAWFTDRTRAFLLDVAHDDVRSTAGQ